MIRATRAHVFSVLALDSERRGVLLYVPADQANKIAGLFWTEHILLSLSILVCDVLYRPVRHCSPRFYFSITRLLFLNATLKQRRPRLPARRRA